SHAAPKAATATPAVATPEPAVAAAAATGASRGIEVQTEGDAGPIAGYLSLVRDKVGGNWQAPVAVGRHGEVRVVVVGTIDREGGAPWKVPGEESPGNSQFDRAAMSAVLNARPLPPLPPGWATDTIGIQFTFHQEY